MKRLLFVVLAMAMVVPVWAATNNSGNPPTFLWLDVCTNGIGNNEAGLPTPIMSPDTVDIGVDLDADGSVDRWLSGEETEFLGRDNASEINPYSWRRYYIRLDADAGKTAQIHIVDNSSEYWIAVNAIRLNYADGTVVPNLVPNGFFEDAVTDSIPGWELTDGNVDAASLILENTDSMYALYGSHILSTMTDPAAGDGSETATLVSETFELTAPTSFVYGMVSGGGSEFWMNEGAGGSDNASGVFLDIADESGAFNGEFDEGHDVPLTGFIGLNNELNVRNQNHPVIINTSGLEGSMAQVTAIDNSAVFHVGMDSWRMNWGFDAEGNEIITNGGFDDGLPEPGDDYPDEIFWFAEETMEYTYHPDGSIPGWTVTQTGGANVFFFDGAVHGNQFSGRTYVGTGGLGDVDRELTGVMLQSDPFEITPIPDPSQNVFVQFNSAQGSARFRYTEDGSVERGIVQLRVDVNGDGTFDGDEDYAYTQVHQGMGQNLNTSNMDLWQYPEYRFYILPEHQGLEAQIYVEDTLGPVRGSYGWMCVDDFYVWDGAVAALPFENSDFEMGDLTNWTEEVGINGGGLLSWLSGSVDSYADALVDHVAMNNRHTMADGEFAADSAPNEYDNGDAGTGTLVSTSFVLPQAGSDVDNWSLF